MATVLAGRRKGSGSHSGEWRGSGVIPGARRKATAVTCTWDETKRKLQQGVVTPILAIGPFARPESRFLTA